MKSWKRTFWAIWVAQLFSIIGFSFAMPFLGLFIKTDLGITNETDVTTWAGNAAAAMGFTMAFFAPIWGLVADRYGRKPMVLRSMFCGAIILALMSQVRTVEQLVLLRMIQGVVTGTVTANLVFAASIAPIQHSTYAVSMMHAAVLAGGCIGPFIGGRLAYIFGYRTTFVLSSILLVIGGLLTYFVVEENFTPVPREDRHIWRSFSTLFTTRAFVVAIMALMMVHFAFIAPSVFLPLFIARLIGTSEGAEKITGDMLSTAGIAAALSAAFFGRFAQTWGRKRILIGCAVAAAIISILHVFAGNVRQLFLLRASFSAVAAGIIPSTNAIIRRVVHENNLGVAYGLTASVMCLGIALGPSVAGYLTVYFNNDYRVPFLLSGAVLSLVVLFAIFWIDSRAVEEPATTNQ